MTFGPGERLGQEQHVGCDPLHLGDQPLPEGDRLGVRVVHPEDPDTAGDPEVEDLLARVPQRDPVGLGRRPEVERVDVLVLLGRVLGVGDGAVRPVVEPLGVLRDPGVVGRALQGVVEGHLHPVRPLPRRPSGRSRRPCRAPGRSRCGRPRSPRWPRGCPGRQARPSSVLSRPLRAVMPDRVDRRQVQDVEAHGRDLGHAPGRPLEAAERSREQLVPGADQSPLAVHPQRHRVRRGQVRGVSSGSLRLRHPCRGRSSASHRRCVCGPHGERGRRWPSHAVVARRGTRSASRPRGPAGLGGRTSSRPATLRYGPASTARTPARQPGIVTILGTSPAVTGTASPDYGLGEAACPRGARP